MNDSADQSPGVGYPPCRVCGKTVYFFMGEDICLDCKDMGLGDPEELLEAFRELRREHPEWFERPGNDETEKPAP